MKPSQVPSPKIREHWIDVAKGGMILLMIFSHVIVSSTDAGQIRPNGWWSALNYPLQMSAVMAVFTFISGMFVKLQLARPNAFLKTIGSNLLWPYAVWVAIFLAAQALAHEVRNAAGTVEFGWSVLWTSIGWLWYLCVLAMFHLLALLLRARLWLIPLLGLAILPLTELAPTLLGRQISYLLLFYGLGAWLGHSRLPRVPAAGLLAPVLGFWAWYEGLHYFHILTVPISFLWLTVTIDLSRRVNGAVQRVLVWLGRRSFAIYVSHFFFISATRIVLERGFGIADFAIQLPLGYAAGLSGPLALLALAQRFGFAAVLGFQRIPEIRLRRLARTEGG